MSWIFTLISLIFCCVAAFYLHKSCKINKKLSEELFSARIDSCNIVDKALRKAMEAINAPESEGYLVIASSDTPKAYSVWRKVDAMEQSGFKCACYGMAYILVKMFDSDNAEENLKNATELCDKLNEEL